MALNSTVEYLQKDEMFMRKTIENHETSAQKLAESLESLENNLEIKSKEIQEQKIFNSLLCEKLEAFNKSTLNFSFKSSEENSAIEKK